MLDEPTRSGPRAVIVGAGIGGLAAAIGLLRAGWAPTVFERSPTPGGLGAGVSLWSNALAALDALGVGAAVRRAGTLQGGGGVRTPDGQWLARSSGAALLERAGVALLLMHRAQLHSELLAALPTDVVVAGAIVTEIQQTVEQVVVGYDGRVGVAPVELSQQLGGNVGGPAGDRGERAHARHDRGRAQRQHHRDRVNPALLTAAVGDLGEPSQQVRTHPGRGRRVLIVGWARGRRTECDPTGLGDDRMKQQRSSGGQRSL